VPAPRQPERRQELLDATVEFLLDHGVRGFSLGAVAEAVGTSPRMLVYHFGSKAQLIDAGVGEARRRQRELFGSWLSPRPGTSYPRVLEQAWRSLETDDAQRYNRFFAEVAALARQPGSPFEGFGEHTVYDWLPLAIEGFRSDGYDTTDAQTRATLALAAMKGLILDLAATGQRPRIRAASRLLAESLERPQR
jgi:AcrR family transcriptional regulator